MVCRRLLIAAILAGASPPAGAQGVGGLYGAYNGSASLSLAPGNFAPLQLDQTGNLKVDCLFGCGPGNGQGVTGNPSSATGSLTGAANVLGAEAGNVVRLHFTIVDLAAAQGASLYCTDDGSTPSPTNASFIVYAQGFYERDTPAWVPSAAIACIPSSGAVPYRAESYP